MIVQPLRFVVPLCAAALLAATARGRDNVLVSGDPPLTREMVDRYTDVQEFLFNLRLGADRPTYQKLFAEDWEHPDGDLRKNVQDRLKWWEDVRIKPPYQRFGQRVRQLPTVLEAVSSSRAKSDRWLWNAYQAAYQQPADLRPLAVMDRQPGADPATTAVVGVDPRPQRVFDRPTVFARPQLYSFYVYLINPVRDDLGRQTVLEQSGQWWFLPNGRAHIKLTHYLGPMVPDEEVHDTVIAVWGRYTVEDGFRIRVETDLNEKMKLYLADGRRMLVCAGQAFNSMLDEDRILLQGTWLLVRGQRDGKQLSEDALGQTKSCTFAGNTFTQGTGDNTERGQFKTNWSARPRTIDFTFIDGPRQGQKLLGIYELSGDTFRVCWSLAGKTRPMDFTAWPGSNRLLLVWQRQKK
jgi:uncharacterized protein (TIGR03067 family)